MDRYRAWVAHAKEGCKDCAHNLRLYNREAKREQRQRDREGVEAVVGYSDELRKIALDDAARIGVKRAAAKHGVSQPQLYKWQKLASASFQAEVVDSALADGVSAAAAAHNISQKQVRTFLENAGVELPNA